MFSLYRALMALRVLGIQTMLREIFRRLTRRPYSYNNIVNISSDVDFITLFYLLEKGIKLRKEKEFIVAETRYGDFYVRDQDFTLLLSLIYNPEEDYGFIEYQGKIVLDLGAYYGDTALFFLKKGARFLYLYEPVKTIYDYLLINLEKNGIDPSKYRAFNIGAWIDDDIVYTRFNMQGTGLTPFINYDLCKGISDCVELKLKSLKEILEESLTGRDSSENIVKIDCEGCEYSILTVSCNTISLADNYIVEIHGVPNPIVYKYDKCGFKAELKKKQSTNYITLWHFYKE